MRINSDNSDWVFPQCFQGRKNIYLLSGSSQRPCVFFHPLANERSQAKNFWQFSGGILFARKWRPLPNGLQTPTPKTMPPKLNVPGTTRKQCPLIGHVRDGHLRSTSQYGCLHRSEPKISSHTSTYLAFDLWSLSSELAYNLIVCIPPQEGCKANILLLVYYI